MTRATCFTCSGVEVVIGLWMPALCSLCTPSTTKHNKKVPQLSFRFNPDTQSLYCSTSAGEAHTIRSLPSHSCFQCFCGQQHKAVMASRWAAAASPDALYMQPARCRHNIACLCRRSRAFVLAASFSAPQQPANLCRSCAARKGCLQARSAVCPRHEDDVREVHGEGDSQFCLPPLLPHARCNDRIQLLLTFSLHRPSRW